MDPYFGRREVSNSTLSTIKYYFQPPAFQMDPEVRDKAFAFGTLIDAMITEPEKVDYFKQTVGKLTFSLEDFDRAKRMKDAFYKDKFCSEIVSMCECQKVSIKHGFDINHEGIEFQLDVKCKWDLFVPGFDLSGDIKSTTAETQEQFMNALNHFDYDRQRAWYMDIENRSNDILIGISKVNFKIFKVPVKRDSELYRSGRAKYEELAFKYWALFS